MDAENLEVKSSIVNILRNTLDDYNPYVQTYRTIRDTIMLNPTPLKLRLRILGKRGREFRRYNLPTASEAATLIIGDFDDADFDKDVIVETQSRLLQMISVFEPAYLPLVSTTFSPRRGWISNRYHIQ